MAKGKIRPNGIEPSGEQFGTTIHHSHPAKFPSPGTQRKKKGSGTAEIHDDSPHGITFLDPGKSPAEMPRAPTRPKESKVISDARTEAEPHDSSCEKSASQKSGEGGPTTPKYELARSYEKKGKKGSTRAPSL